MALKFTGFALWTCDRHPGVDGRIATFDNASNLVGRGHKGSVSRAFMTMLINVESKPDNGWGYQGHG